MQPPECWYASRALGDGVIHLFEPYIKDFYRCNMWYVRGRDSALLFDSGLGALSLCAQFPWLRDTPLIAVASHAHFDHIGSHHEFAQRACHPAEAHILAHPTPESTLAARFAKLTMFERLPPGGFDEARYRVQPAPPTRLLEHGDILDLGDRTFTVMHLPGHSPGSIALWDASRRMLLAGDAVYDGPLVDDAYHSHVGDYIASMHRLRELPAETVHAGHYASFGRDRLRELIDEYVQGRRAPGCPSATSSMGVRSA